MSDTIWLALIAGVSTIALALIAAIWKVKNGKNKGNPS